MFKRNKYNAVKTVVDGIKFDSKMEAKYYEKLKADGVKILDTQPKVYLTKARILYKVDFLIEEDGVPVWVEVKGQALPVFKLKKRLWKHYGPGKLIIVYAKKIEEVISEREN